MKYLPLILLALLVRSSMASDVLYRVDVQMNYAQNNQIPWNEFVDPRDFNDSVFQDYLSQLAAQRYYYVSVVVRPGESLTIFRHYPSAYASAKSDSASVAFSSSTSALTCSLTNWYLDNQQGSPSSSTLLLGDSLSRYDQSLDFPLGSPARVQLVKRTPGSFGGYSYQSVGVFVCTPYAVDAPDSGNTPPATQPAARPSLSPGPVNQSTPTLDPGAGSYDRQPTTQAIYVSPGFPEFHFRPFRNLVGGSTLSFDRDTGRFSVGGDWSWNASFQWYLNSDLKSFIDFSTYCFLALPLLRMNWNELQRGWIAEDES